MQALTREQRVALKRVYDRAPIENPAIANDDYSYRYPDSIKYLSYRQFRKTVQQSCGCVMVQWCNMWLGIEKDGHTHS